MFLSPHVIGFGLAVCCWRQSAVVFCFRSYAVRNVALFLFFFACFFSHGTLSIAASALFSLFFCRFAVSSLRPARFCSACSVKHGAWPAAELHPCAIRRQHERAACTTETRKRICSVFISVYGRVRHSVGTWVPILIFGHTRVCTPVCSWGTRVL